MPILERLNQRAAQSWLGRYFKLEGSGAVGERPGTSLTMELRAGLATFVAMAYIISVNSIVYAMQVALGFWIMLVFMTYNAYLMGSVVVGAGIGHYLFARDISSAASKALSCH